jgi:DNA-directed RNA polymerase subunit K/omega
MNHDVQYLLSARRGKYLLVNSLARRVRALQSGSKPLVSRHDNNLVETAFDEFRQGKILVKSRTEEDAAAGGADAAE